MSALVLTADLVLISQLSGAAMRSGTTVEVAGSIEDLLSKADAGEPSLVILDLSHAGLVPGDVVGRLKPLLPAATILAFGPHVHKGRLAAASAAGCDTVMSRGQFHAEMDAILREYSH